MVSGSGLGLGFRVRVRTRVRVRVRVEVRVLSSRQTYGREVSLHAVERDGERDRGGCGGGGGGAHDAILSELDGARVVGAEAAELVRATVRVREPGLGFGLGFGLGSGLGLA